MTDSGENQMRERLLPQRRQPRQPSTPSAWRALARQVIKPPAKDKNGGFLDYSLPELKDRLEAAQALARVLLAEEEDDETAGRGGRR